MKRLLFLCIVLFMLPGLSAQNPYWVKDVGPYGGLVSISPTLGSVVYARYNYRKLFYRSTDYGEHWTSLEVQTVDPEAESETFYIGPSGIFYAIVSKQIDGNIIRHLYRSADEGNTWAILNDQDNLRWIAETPSGALIGYNTNYDLYRSSDGGFNWQYTDSVTNFFYSPRLLCGNAGKLTIVDDSNKLLYSLDDGQTWHTGGSWSDPNLFNIISVTLSENVFRLQYNHALQKATLYRSTDWGLQWIPVDLDLATQEMARSVTELAGGRLLLATSRHIYFSDDAGVSWNILSSSAETPNELLSNISLSNGHLLGLYKNELYRSSDQGNTWTFSLSGVQLADTKQLVTLNDSLFLAASNIGLWRSFDAGDTWVRLLSDTSSHDFSDNWNFPEHPIAMVNADTFAFTTGRTVWGTTNSGQHFQDITPPNKLASEHFFAVKSGRLFANDALLGMMLSDDVGSTWQSILPNQEIRSLRQHPSGTLFAIIASINAISAAGLYRSSDNGSSWEKIVIAGFLSSDYFSSLDINAQGEIYVVGYFSETYHLAQSSDLGETWTFDIIPFGSAFGPLAVNALNHVFTTGGGQYKLFSTADLGQSWYDLPPYAPHFNPLHGIEISPSGHLYILPFYGSIHRTSQSTQTGGYIRGQVLRDADADCSTPDAQTPLQNWVVEINGEQDYIVSSSNAGTYTFYGDTGIYQLHARVPQNLWWTICDSLLTVQIDSAQTVDSVDFVGVALSECPLMTVDVAVPQLRRCFNNTVYVSYCNSGSEAADSAWVDIELDPFLSLVSSEQAHESLGNNTYRFQLGDVDWGDCGSFVFTVYVDCDSTVLGQTHCIGAHAFPDTLCNPVPDWSGANIVANATCQDSVVQLQLQNTGTNPSGTLNYIIIEDDVVLFQGQEQYDVNESVSLNYPANGSTWRIESQQEPGHPFSNLALAFSEGCGGYESLGFINQFSVNGWTPSINQACLENTGSYDPNDKQGFPLGYGDQQRIRPGQNLEYLIRFQNTGTDTAFTVQIRDTLSAWLDPGTIRPGASSHPYTWDLSGPGVLTFRFDNILLPDSNVNLLGSQGFISFWIDQRSDVPLETQIFNSAAIYFDFNEPVITNRTLHTVGIDYVTATKHVEKQEMPAILVQPNPASNETLLTLPPGTERLTLLDMLGRPLRMISVRGNTYRLERGNLPAGMYLLRAEDRNGKVTGSGKLIWQ